MVLIKVLKERVNKGTQCQLNDPTGPIRQLAMAICRVAKRKSNNGFKRKGTGALDHHPVQTLKFFINAKIIKCKI